MTLLQGGFLVAGLVAVTIPILIHLLFRRRRPPLEWAAMDVLLEALRKQQQRLKLEQWLLLATRCLLFALAGLALARPVLEGTGVLRPQANRTITIVLDDGIASQAAAAGGEAAFASLQEQAAQLVRGLASGDSVSVILASRPARPLVAPPTTDRDAVARAIEAVDASYAATDIAAALRQVSVGIGRDPTAEHIVVIASEFRHGSLDPSSVQPVALAPSQGERAPRIVALKPATNDLANTAITALEAQRSIDDDSITVTARLDRAGGGNPATSVRVTIAGDGTTPTAPKTVRFDAGQATARVDFVLRPSSDVVRIGHGGIVASLAARPDDDALAADDIRHAIFDARSATQIGIVARRSFGSGAEIEQVPASRWLARALMPVEQPGIDIAEVEPAALDARTLRELDALLVPRPEALPPEAWPELRRFVDRGGLLVVMPSSEANVQRWTDGFAAAFGLPWQIASEAQPLETPLAFAAEQPQQGNTNGLFASIDAELSALLRPVEVMRRIEVRNAAPGDAVLLLDDNSPFLLLTSPVSSGAGVSRGLVALVTVAPELTWTNLPVKPFMVPFTQELVRRSLARIGGSERAIVAERPMINVRDAHELAGPEGRRVGTDHAGLAATPLDRPGTWSALDVAGRTVGGIAVNVDPLATRMTSLSTDVVSKWVSSAAPVTFGDVATLSTQLTPSVDAVGAAVWLLVAVLVLAIVETLLARWFSHGASARGAADDPGITSSALRDDPGVTGGIAA
ncbi:MAG: BatA domain-containing protein [Phycisphaerae bacterium]|mgnify:CR=1 FL=1|nr:BatA domain-containing protein [Phycisphaerae bacterium]